MSARFRVVSAIEGLLTPVSLSLYLSVSLARTRASGSAARPSHRRGRFTPQRAIPRPSGPPASPGRCISPGPAFQPARMRCCRPSSPFAWRLVAQDLPPRHRQRRDHRHRPRPPRADDVRQRRPPALIERARGGSVHAALPPLARATASNEPSERTSARRDRSRRARSSSQAGVSGDRAETLARRGRRALWRSRGPPPMPVACVSIRRPPAERTNCGAPLGASRRPIEG